MMKVIHRKPVCLMLVLGTLSGCMSNQTSVAARDVWAGSQSQRLMKVEECQVISSRAIAISPDDSASLQREATSGAVAGVAGGAIGYTFAKNIGKGSGNDLAKVLGAAVGYQVGNNIGRQGAKQNLMKPGVAYQIRTSGGTRQVIQEVSTTAEVLPAGSYCSLVNDRGQARVLPR